MGEIRTFKFCLHLLLQIISLLSLLIEELGDLLDEVDVLHRDVHRSDLLDDRTIHSISITPFRTLHNAYTMLSRSAPVMVNVGRWCVCGRG
jgi:hypothetical protein